MKHIYLKCLLVFAAILGAGASFGQTVTWTEKYPPNVKIVAPNALSIYLAANFGKIGEIAANKIEALLNDPAMQAKVSMAARDKLLNLYNDPTKTTNQKATEVIAWIEADIGSLVSTPYGSFNGTIGYSANYDVMRLAWDQVKVRTYCQKEACSCANGGYAPFSGYMCTVTDWIGGQPYTRYEPAYCTYRSDTVDASAGFSIYRNSKLIAQIGEARQITSGYAIPGFDLSGILGFLDLSLNVVLPPSSIGTAGRAVFYDYDPHNATLGTHLTYEIRSSLSGCGAGYTNTYSGYGTGSNPLYVDMDGDAKPDYYPADVFAAKRAESTRRTAPRRGCTIPSACL